MNFRMNMTETKLALIGFFGGVISLAIVIQWLQVTVLILSVVSLVLSIVKHFKK